MGFDLSHGVGLPNIFTDQQILQGKLGQILQKITSVENICCASASQLNIRVAFHVLSSGGHNVFETEFEEFNPLIVNKLLELQTDDRIELNAELLSSYIDRFKGSTATAKVRIF